MGRKFYTSYDVNSTNLHILTARRMSHIDSNWPTLKLEKKIVRAFSKPKLETYESEDHRLQYFRIKKSGRKFQIIGTLNDLIVNLEICCAMFLTGINASKKIV